MSYFHFDDRFSKAVHVFIACQSQTSIFALGKSGLHWMWIPLSSNCDQTGRFRWGYKHGSTRRHVRLSKNANDCMFVQSCPTYICFMQSGWNLFQPFSGLPGGYFGRPSFLPPLCINIDLVTKINIDLAVKIF